MLKTGPLNFLSVLSYANAAPARHEWEVSKPITTQPGLRIGFGSLVSFGSLSSGTGLRCFFIGLAVVAIFSLRGFHKGNAGLHSPGQRRGRGREARARG